VNGDVTVVVPTIPTRPRLLDRALTSVWAQERPPDAVIVEPDDDGTGAAATRNRALARVTTEWVAWLDDDDELRPRHLALLLGEAEVSGADLVYPWFDVVNGTDPLAVTVGGVLRSPLGVPFLAEQAEHLRHRGNFIPVTTLVRTETARAAGGFPTPGSEEWPHTECEDWGFLIRLLDAGARFSHLPERTWLWHHHAANTSGRADRWRNS